MAATKAPGHGRDRHSQPDPQRRGGRPDRPRTGRPAISAPPGGYRELLAALDWVYRVHPTGAQRRPVTWSSAAMVASAVSDRAARMGESSLTRMSADPSSPAMDTLSS